MEVGVVNVGDLVRVLSAFKQDALVHVEIDTKEASDIPYLCCSSSIEHVYEDSDGNISIRGSVGDDGDNVYGNPASAPSPTERAS
jgi:hypothetical protein